MTPLEEAAAFANLPGRNGAIARLTKHWDPSGVDLWLATELARGTRPTDIAAALGEVMAAAVYAAMSNVPPSIDRLAFLNGDLGVLGTLKAQLERRIEREHKPQDGVILPS